MSTSQQCLSAGVPVTMGPPDARPLCTTWSPPGGAYVAGRWQDTRLTMPVTDPEDGRVIGHVADCSNADVSAAVADAAASAAVDDWPVWARKETLHRAAGLLEQETGTFAHLIATEGVKTITEAEAEVARGAETLRLSAEAAACLTGETIPFGASPRGGDRIGWFTREPVGVVAAITSFNDPLNLVAHKLGPALMGGNGVVLKPSTHTPYTALAFVELLLRAGVPARRVAVVCGGATTGQALVSDPGVALVSFTGGPATAARITAAAGPRKMLMELGGNNPTIVCADGALSTAAEAIVAGAFGVAGQNCLSVQRVYVHASAYPELLRLVVDHTRRLTVGSKRDRGTDVGPLVDEAAACRVEDCVDEAVAAGACLRVGGTRSGAYYAPTVLTDVRPGARVLTEEIFGPVVTIAPYENITDAVAAANDSDYALQAGLFTRSVDNAFATAARLTCGAVVVNGTSDLRLDSMPFGGFKSSGIGREGVRYALEAMTETKSTIVNLVP